MMHLKPSPEYPGRHVHSWYWSRKQTDYKAISGAHMHSLISACMYMCMCIDIIMTVCTTLRNSPWQLVASDPKMNPGIQSQEYLPVVMFVQIVFLPHGFCAHVTESAWTHYYTMKPIFNCFTYTEQCMFPEFDSRGKVLSLATPSIATNTIRMH